MIIKKSNTKAEQQAVEQYKKGLLEWLETESEDKYLEVDGVGNVLNHVKEKIQSGDLDKAVE